MIDITKYIISWRGLIDEITNKLLESNFLLDRIKEFERENKDEEVH